MANSAPGGPSEDDIWIVGTPWSTFATDDIVVYKGGTWLGFEPFIGLFKVIGSDIYVYEGSAGWQEVSTGGGGSARDTVSALATSGAVTVDHSLGDYFTLGLAGNVTSWSFTNMPGSGKGASLIIRITQDSTPRTVTWPASFRWSGGVADSVSTASGAVDVLAITTLDNGTTWNATLSKGFA